MTDLQSLSDIDLDESSSSFIFRLTRVLTCLSDGINTVTDIARCCNLSTSTTHRLLNILKGPLLTVYDPGTHHYYLGPLITKLASRPNATHQYLVMCALSEMKRLAAITGETISLDLIMGIQFIHAYDIPSKHSLRVLDQTTEIQPVIPLGPAQKVLLSQLNEKELKLALKIAQKWDQEEQPAADMETIKEQIAEIRRQGYAISHGEAISGSLGIAAPIKHGFYPVSLAILGPENRLKDRIPELTKELLTSTGRISRDLQEFFS